MPRQSFVLPFTIAIVAGALLWWLTSAFTGAREAWDSAFYWRITYPLSIVVAAVLGYRYPVGAWLWGALVMLGQAVILSLGPGSWNLWPLTLVALVVQGVPAVVAAWLAARLRRRREWG